MLEERGSKPAQSKEGIVLGEQSSITIGSGDVTGGDKIAAGGHVIQAGAGATVIIGMSSDPANFKEKSQLREWWHGILRSYGRYYCYAIFLVLPSDKEALRYLTDFGREIDLISGVNCLVIALGKTEFKRSGFNEETWSELVKEHSSEGYSRPYRK